MGGVTSALMKAAIDEDHRRHRRTCKGGVSLVTVLDYDTHEYTKSSTYPPFLGSIFIYHRFHYLIYNLISLALFAFRLAFITSRSQHLKTIRAFHTFNLRTKSLKYHPSASAGQQVRP